MAIFGWGYLILRLCGFSKKIDLGWQGSLGLAFLVAAGGVLNYFQLVSKSSLIIFLAVGLGFKIFSLAVNWGVIRDSFANFRANFKNRKVLTGLLALILLVVVVRYGFSTAFFNFSPIDDQHAYLVFPVKMLETGSMGQDPFSERRMLSSLGGQYFLGTFILAAGEIKNLHLMDNGLGFIIFLLVLYGLTKDRKLPIGFSLLIVFLAAIIPSPTVNITSFFTAAAVVLAILRFMPRAGEFWPNKTGRLLVLALLCAGACALKSNLVLPVAVLYLSYFFWEIKSGQGRFPVFKDFVQASVLILLLLLPWMLSSYKSSGTLFYPFLGKGYAVFVNSALSSHYLEINLYSLYRLASEVINGLGMFLPFVAVVLVWLFSESGKNKNAALTALLMALIGILGLIYGSGGYSLYYYSFSFLLPAVLFALILLLEKGDLSISPKVPFPSALLGLVCMGVLFGVYVEKDIVIFQSAKAAVNIDKGNLKFGLMSSDLMPALELKQYRALQEAVPRGELILARLDRNFLFDFNRNPVYIIDSPGITSPPPGMPYGQGSEALASYLLEQNVRYVAYSYGNEANFHRANAGTMLLPHVNPLLKGETLGSFDFQDNLKELGTIKKIIYDDGKNFVLDLQTGLTR